MRMVYAHTAENSQLFVDAIHTDLASGLEVTKVLLNRPHANNPAGWVSKLWDCWCSCVTYCLVVACQFAEDVLSVEWLPFPLLNHVPMWLVAGAVAAALVSYAALSMLLLDTVWTLPIELAVFLLRRLNSIPPEALSS